MAKQKLITAADNVPWREITDDLLREDVVSSQRLVLTEQISFFSLYQETVQLSTGEQSTRFVLKHPGAVAVLAITDKQEVIMERQWRQPLRSAFWEIPAGKKHEGEDPLLAMQRELQEETGYVAKRWKRLGEFHPCIGYANEVIHLYMAQDLSLGDSNLDDGELLHVVKIPFAEAIEMIHQGHITDGKTIAALMKAQRLLGKDD